MFIRASIAGKLVNTVLHPLGIKLVRSNSGLASDSKCQQAKSSKPNPPKFVNIGSGGWTYPKWHTLDKPSDWYASSQDGKLDYHHDLMSFEPLPFETNSLEAIFCSHVIEHLPNENIRHLFEEAFRVLERGGYFRLTCPDIKLIYDAFSRKDSFFMNRFAFHKHYPEPLSLNSSFLHCFAGTLVRAHPCKGVRKITDAEVEKTFNTLPLEEALNYFINMIPLKSQADYPADHLNWFHKEKVLELLKIAGFEHRYISAFGQSRSPYMIDSTSFDTTQPWMSLYVECRKY